MSEQTEMMRIRDLLRRRRAIHRERLWRETVSPLGGYYVPTRYPDGLPDSIPVRVYMRRSAEETLEMTDRVL